MRINRCYSGFKNSYKHFSGRMEYLVNIICAWVDFKKGFKTCQIKTKTLKSGSGQKRQG